MKEIVKRIEELVDQEVENETLKTELAEIKKMLKIGFEGNFVGYERIPILYSTADEKKIKKLYDNLANQIKAIAMCGNFEKFGDYISINHSINIDVPEKFPEPSFTKNDKKKNKFYDLYSTYYLEDVPKDAKIVLDKLTQSLYNINKEFKTQEEPIKEDFKNIMENDPEYSSLVLKTLSKIIKASKKKAETLEDSASTVEQKLNEQMKAIELIED